MKEIDEGVIDNFWKYTALFHLNLLFLWQKIMLINITYVHNICDVKRGRKAA